MTPEQAASVGIEVAPLRATPASRGAGFPARVTIPPNQISVVAVPIAARIESIDVVDDQVVEPGAVLARLNSPALIRAQSEFLQAANQERFLQETLNREQSLSSDRTVSLKQMQATRNEYSQATATVAERRQMLRDYGMSADAIERLVSTRDFDSKTAIVAPVGGTVIDLSVSPGQRVEAQTPLLKIARLTPLWIELQVPPRRASAFRVGMSVDVPAFGATAKVISVGSSADRSTQAVTVRAELSDASAGLRPGQFIEAFVTFSGSEKTWSVRPESIVRRGRDTVVFVRTDKGFRVQPVTVIEEDRDAAQVTGPLQAEDSIAIRGIVALKGAWQGLGGSQ
jgi:RND family efflux transporter MFP subunit